jgi:hypothetical protein
MRNIPIVVIVLLFVALAMPARTQNMPNSADIAQACHKCEWIEIQISDNNEKIASWERQTRTINRISNLSDPNIQNALKDIDNAVAALKARNVALESQLTDCQKHCMEMRQAAAQPVQPTPVADVPTPIGGSAPPPARPAAGNAPGANQAVAGGDNSFSPPSPFDSDPALPPDCPTPQTPATANNATPVRGIAKPGGETHIDYNPFGPMPPVPADADWQEKDADLTLSVIAIDLGSGDYGPMSPSAGIIDAASYLADTASHLADDRLATIAARRKLDGLNEFDGEQQKRMAVASWLRKERLYYNAWNDYLRTEQEKYPNIDVNPAWFQKCNGPLIKTLYELNTSPVPNTNSQSTSGLGDILGHFSIGFGVGGGRSGGGRSGGTNSTSSRSTTPSSSMGSSPTSSMPGSTLPTTTP